MPIYNNFTSRKAAGQAAWDRLIGKPADINPLMLKEIIFCLEELIFGTDMIGRNVYYLLRRLMLDYKVDANRGIKEWQWRMTQLNNYIMYLPSKALDNCDAFKQEFTEIKMREILDMALTNSYWKKLFGIDWNIYEQTLLKSVDKLQAVVPVIKADAAKAKSDKVYGNKGTKHNNNSTTKVPNASQENYVKNL